MFTGIVEDVGAIVGRADRGPGARLVVEGPWSDLALGESICVSGVCLTVDAVGAVGARRPAGRSSFEVDATAETLSRSTLARARVGTEVNLERALLPTTRLGGHYVVGHADALARVLHVVPLGDATSWRIALPAELARFVAPKGSIAVDGVSLTVNGVGDGWFELVVIPHTLRRTTLRALAAGSDVTLEVDLLARYVARQLEAGRAGSDAQAEPETLESSAIGRKLRDGGYL